MQVRIYMIVKLNSTRVLEKVFHNIPTKYSNKNCRENFKMRQLVDIIHYEITLSQVAHELLNSLHFKSKLFASRVAP